MNDILVQIIKKPWVIPTAVGLVSLGVGATAGYIYGRKKGVDDFIDAVQDQWSPRLIEEVEALYENIENSREEFIDIQESTLETRESFNEYRKLVEDYGLSESLTVEDITNAPEEVFMEAEELEEEVEEPLVTHNVFVGDDSWDYDKEYDLRETLTDEPYYIHVDEYLRNDLGYRQETLTYYALDDTLCAEDDRAVWNYRKLTGELMFGHGSNDKNVAYIRNTAVRVEWEILYHHGSFAAEVEGHDVAEGFESADLKHSNNRKFRQED
jgi:hypothetical protein